MNMVYFEKLFSGIIENNIATGGFILMILGSALTIFYRLSIRIFNWLCRLIVVKIHAREYTKAYNYLTAFMNNLEYTKEKCSQCTSIGWSKAKIVPLYGYHLFFYKNRPFLLNYSVDKDKMFYMEHIKLSTIKLFNKRKLITEIIQEGERLFKEDDYEKTKIYTISNDKWEVCNEKSNISTPVLNNYSELISKITCFLDSEEEYIRDGRSYKLGCLFHGPPGNGKTTTIINIAQNFKKHLCIVNLSSLQLKEDKLLCLLGNMPANSVLCIEDIDTMKVSNDRETSTNTEKTEIKNSITLSTLLNIFDGPYTPHGLIFFLTTNYKDKLDSAIIRPGRIDIDYEFTNATKEQITNIMQKLNLQLDSKQFINQPMAYVSQELYSYKYGTSTTPA